MLNIESTEIARTMMVMRTARIQASQARREAFEARMAAKEHPVDMPLRSAGAALGCLCEYAGCGLCSDRCYKDARYLQW